MKRIVNVAFIGLFMGICTLPALVMPFSGEVQPLGNEKKAEMPLLVNENGLNNSFSEECETYFSQNNPLRPTLIELQNNIKLDALHSSSNGVIAGKNNYLFSEETVNDYLGKTLSNRKLYSIAKTVQLTQKYVNSSGGSFVFTVVPNKNSIYSDYMPNRYIKSETNNLSLLTEYLKKLDVNYVDLKDTFITNNNQELYLRDDTHWNNLGAFYGFNEIMKGLGKENHLWKNVRYSVKEDFVGDLTKMAYPLQNRKCNQYYLDNDFSEYSFVQPSVMEDNDTIMNTLMGDEEKIDGLIRTINENAEGSLYMLRDSFGRALLPYMVEHYAKTYITRYQPVNLTGGKYTDVVWEVVERNLKDITRSVPVVMAQNTELEINPEAKSGENKVWTRDNDSVISITGLLDKSYFSDTSDIYIVLESNSQAMTYEAFPILDSTLADSDIDAEYGFSLQINKSELNSGDYVVYAVVLNDDNGVATEALTKININTGE